MKKIGLLLSIAALSFSSLQAQSDDVRSRLYIGASGGVRINFMRFSDLNKKTYPDKDAVTGGVFSVFVDYEFGDNLRFALRPEFDFVRRGARLSNINSEVFGKGVTDQTYRVKANYWDFRLPIAYNFGGADSRFRPYLYVAPVLGFPSSGNIELRGVGTDGSNKYYAVDLSKSNIASTYFGLAAGAGFKYNFPLAGNTGYVGLEAVYEHGLTDTYSSNEKNHSSAVNTTYFPKDYEVNGTRKFSGLEFRLTVGIPIGVFKVKKTEPPVQVQESVPEPPKAEAKTVEQTCYTLDEIIALMARGEDVRGKIICAIDDINFDFNKSEIKEESFGYLDKLARTLVRMNARVEVKGHTDNIGPDEVNMRISRQRAKAVVDYLIHEGVNRDKITYSYYGATRPLVSNETIQGRRMNRRVEIEILK